jgi:hypothetical protein
VALQPQVKAVMAVQQHLLVLTHPQVQVVVEH